MHDAVRQWVAEALPKDAVEVLEIGSLDINGGITDLLPEGSLYFGIDMQEGPGVNLVADGAHYTHTAPVDVVVCLEVFEHTDAWPEIVANARANLLEHGVFIGTAAAPGRPPHSARRESVPDPDEHYENIHAASLAHQLDLHFSDWQINVVGHDIRWKAMC